MPARLEDIVQHVMKARSEFELANIPFQDIKDAAQDLLRRIEALERNVPQGKAPAPGG